MPSMHQLAVTMMSQRLKALAAILKKGAQHAAARGFDPKVLLDARLSPDMFPLSRQVQIAADIAKAGATRLAGIEPPSFPDNEESFAELQQRIAKTIEILKSIKSAQMQDSEKRLIKLPMRTMSLEFEGQNYLLDWVLPNVFFHITTAYNILRHNGVALGKSDYLAMTPKSVAKKKTTRKAKPNKGR